MLVEQRGLILTVVRARGVEMRRYFSFILLTSSMFPVSALSDEHRLSIEIKRDGGAIQGGVKNISARNVHLPPIYFADPKNTGYWFFMYDMENKDIYYAWSRGFSYPDMGVMPLETLYPGQSITFEYELDDLTPWFPAFSRGGCFYFMVKYMRESGGSTLSSATSNPVVFCNNR